MISRLLREKLITNFLIYEVLIANNHFDLAKAVCMDFAEKWEVSSFFKRCLNIHRPLISHSTTFLYWVTKQLYNSAIPKCVWLTMFWSWSGALHLALSVHILKTVNLFHLSSPHGVLQLSFKVSRFIVCVNDKAQSRGYLLHFCGADGFLGVLIT